MFRMIQKFKIKAKYTKSALKREVQDSYKKTEESELFCSCVSERHWGELTIDSISKEEQDQAKMSLCDGRSYYTAV